MARGRVGSRSQRASAAERSIAAQVADVVVQYADVLAQASPEQRRVIVRAISVLAAFGEDLPDELEREICAISLYGVDPEWQIDELRKILERFAPRQ